MRTAQLARRALYLVAGVAPACFGALLATALGDVSFIGAFAGTIGLILATAAWLPASQAAYWTIAILLGAGLAVMGVFLAGGAVGMSAPRSLGEACLQAWLFLCPVACAAHFLWKGRTNATQSSIPR